MAIALVAASILSMLPLAPNASAEDSAGRCMQNTLTEYHSYLNGEGHYAPSLMRYAHQNDLTAVRTMYRYRTQQQRVEIADGLSSRLVSLEANTYVHLSRRITAYGDASYRYRRIRAVELLNSSDYAITFPYTSATEAGGEDRQSSYSFSGGCDVALRFGTLGGKIAYRAMQAHRVRDPRPLNIVSDFHGLFGYSVPLGGTHSLAGIIGCDVYKQSSEVSIYNPQDEPLYLLMNGIGNSFQRQNLSDSPVLYRLRGYSGTLALRPLGGDGFWGLARFTQRELQRFAVRANVAPINFYTEPSWQIYFGYNTTVRAWRLGGHISYSHTLRRGHDYVLGTSGIREYQVLGTVPNYACERITVQAQVAAVTTRWGGARYCLMGTAYRQLQNTPRLALTRAALGHTISGYGIVRMRRHALRLEASAQCVAPLDGFTKRKFPAAYRYSPLERYARHLFTIHQTVELSGSLGASGIFSLSPRFLFEVGVRGDALRYDARNLRYAVEGHVGLFFQ